MDQIEASNRVFQQQLLRSLKDISDKLGVLGTIQTEFVWAHLCCGKMIIQGHSSACQVCPDDDKAINFKVEVKNIEALKRLIDTVRLSR
jgi:hypothetical protein